MRLRIIIDNQDAQDSTTAPLTLNVYHDDDDGTESRVLHEFSDGGLCLIGANVPDMLRALAIDLEREYEDATMCPTCWGIVPPEGVTMVPEDGELCDCTPDDKQVRA